MEDGRLTDSKGRVVSFKNAVIIMTSNAGSKVIQKSLQDPETSSYPKLKSRVNNELKDVFKPEFLNRMGEVIVFKPSAGCATG